LVIAVSKSQRLMRGAVALALSVALTGGALVASPAPASAQENPAQLCKEFGRPLINFLATLFVGQIFEGAEIGVTQGACVSLVTAGNFTALSASICNDLKQQGFLQQVPPGQCVRAVKGFLEQFFSGPG
jgi:hypothetical protein